MNMYVANYIALSLMQSAFLGKVRTLFVGASPNTKKKVIDRRPRHAIQGSVIYRPNGGLVWYKGTTENVSSTGVLFHGETYIPVDTAIEIAITPSASGSRKAEGVFCWGRVVRTKAPAQAAPQPVLAAKILKFRSKPKFLSDSDIKFDRLV